VLKPQETAPPESLRIGRRCSPADLHLKTERPTRCLYRIGLVCAI
jgi:hypothetical protein